MAFDRKVTTRIRTTSKVAALRNLALGIVMDARSILSYFHTLICAYEESTQTFWAR